LPACLAVSTAAWDALPVEQQQALRHASATTVARFEDVGRTQDRQLLEGLFEKQGLKRVPVTPALEREFEQAAIVAREQLGASLVSAEIMRQVTELLDEYRKKPLADSDVFTMRSGDQEVRNFLVSEAAGSKKNLNLICPNKILPSCPSW